MTSPVLVDSNVLLDLITDDENWSEWSQRALDRLINDALVINPLIYAEVSIGFERIEDLDDALPPTLLKRETLPYEAGFLAGKAFAGYRRRGGLRTSPFADFYIGAHAAIRGYRLLTRDSRRYRTYFPNVVLIAPAC